MGLDREVKDRERDVARGRARASRAKVGRADMIYVLFIVLSGPFWITVGWLLCMWAKREVRRG